MRYQIKVTQTANKRLMSVTHVADARYVSIKCYH